MARQAQLDSSDSGAVIVNSARAAAQRTVTAEAAAAVLTVNPLLIKHIDRLALARSAVGPLVNSGVDFPRTTYGRTILYDHSPSGDEQDIRLATAVLTRPSRQAKGIHCKSIDKQWKVPAPTRLPGTTSTVNVKPSTGISAGPLSPNAPKYYGDNCLQPSVEENLVSNSAFSVNSAGLETRKPASKAPTAFRRRQRTRKRRLPRVKTGRGPGLTPRRYLVVYISETRQSNALKAVIEARLASHDI